MSIHPAAARDLTFWRALLRTALEDPHLVGCPLELLRTRRLPECYIINDACTGIGAGGWISSGPTWIPQESYLWFVLRWTPAEVEAIAARLLPCGQPDDDQWVVVERSLQFYTIPDAGVVANPCPKITINVLEFAIAVFMIMMVAPLLAGQVVSISGDNTAALCWLVKNKSSSGSADTLLKLLSLTCVIYNIRLVAHHTRGIHNPGGLAVPRPRYRVMRSARSGGFGVTTVDGRVLPAHPRRRSHRPAVGVSTASVVCTYQRRHPVCRHDCPDDGVPPGGA